MKIIRMDSGFHFDDPNNRWGNPSYQLEPGDPGYVPPNPPPSTPTQTRKTKAMAKQPFMPNTDAGKQTLLNNFVLKLKDASKGYALKYNIPAATITLLDNGRQWVDATMDALTALRTASQNMTAFKNQLFTGSGAISGPTAPVFTMPAVALAAGIFTLVSSVVAGIKASMNYSVPDGEDMGIEGAVVPSPPAGSVSPDLSKTRLASGGLPEIVWKKHGYSAIRIMVDRGDGKGGGLPRH